MIVLNKIYREQTQSMHYATKHIKTLKNGNKAMTTGFITTALKLPQIYGYETMEKNMFVFLHR